jgi:alkylation response protein AidB-like acyl-CoA dehydrogenase
MEVGLEAATLLIYRAAWLMDQKQPHNVEAAVCKYFITEAGLDIVEKATRIFGAYGASMDMDIQRYFRDMRWLLYGAGTQPMILTIITSEVRKGRR